MSAGDFVRTSSSILRPGRSTGRASTSPRDRPPDGRSDDSYKGGEKEDDVCPKTGDGSIPNNKSDLLAFGAYQEAGPTANDPGFLNVFWSRVSAPTGTTNMDFEFNKSTTDCDGDAGSARAARTSPAPWVTSCSSSTSTRAARSPSSRSATWTGTAWSDAPVDLDAAGGAIGAINQQRDPGCQLGRVDHRPPTPALTARTFGEASFDLSRVFDPTKCESFGSAMLKSRSSDAFNSALKDFIAPIPLNIQNCGTVIIRKVTDPAGERSVVRVHQGVHHRPDLGQHVQPDRAGGERRQDVQQRDLRHGPHGRRGLTVPAGWEFVRCSTARPRAGVSVSAVIDPLTGRSRSRSTQRDGHARLHLHQQEAAGCDRGHEDAEARG